MANLKVDLLNMVSNNKMFAELEFVRLAQDPNMNYEVKLQLMNEELDKIISFNPKVGVIEQFFQSEDNQQANPATPQPNQGQPHQGQTHGE